MLDIGSQKNKLESNIIMGVFVSAHGWAGQGHYKPFACSSESERKNRAQKNNGSAAGGGAAQHCEPSGARRANTIL